MKTYFYDHKFQETEDDALPDCTLALNNFQIHNKSS